MSEVRRPALDRLWVDCRKRRVDAVVVYRYDRFARSLRQLVNALEEFRAMGIEFVSLHEGVDTSTPNGRLVFGMRDVDRLMHNHFGRYHAGVYPVNLGRPFAKRMRGIVRVN